MAKITIKDLSLKSCRMTKRVEALRDAYFKAIPEVCVERPRFITRYCVANGLFEKNRITILDKARIRILT